MGNVNFACVSLKYAMSAPLCTNVRTYLCIYACNMARPLIKPGLTALCVMASKSGSTVSFLPRKKSPKFISPLNGRVRICILVHEIPLRVGSHKKQPRRSSNEIKMLISSVIKNSRNIVSFFASYRYSHPARITRGECWFVTSPEGGRGRERESV